MTAVCEPPELDTRTGQLRAAEPTWIALVAHVTKRPGLLSRHRGDDTAEQLDLLRSADVLDEHGRPHPSLSNGLDAVEQSAIVLDLSYAGKSMRAWGGHTTAGLLLPANADGRHTFTHLRVSLLPEAIARLVDLGPGPRPQPAVPVLYGDGALEDVRRHWRLTGDWRSRAGARRHAVLEVVDTAGGLWLLRPGGDGRQVAWPATSTLVWRHVVQLVLRKDHEGYETNMRGGLGVPRR
ncbi:MAG: hypothetical protein ACRDPK_17235 [Carbonactinosporaceae bacterium]